LTQNKTIKNEGITLAYGHRLADRHLAAFFARKIVIEVRQVVRPHVARAHSLCR